MTGIKGEVPSGFSAEPLDGPAYERAVERGQAAGVRRADALARRGEVDAAALKAARQEKAPHVGITAQIEMVSTSRFGNEIRETKTIESLVPTPKRKRPKLSAEAQIDEQDAVHWRNLVDGFADYDPTERDPEEIADGGVTIYPGPNLGEGTLSEVINQTYGLPPSELTLTDAVSLEAVQIQEEPRLRHVGRTFPNYGAPTHRDQDQ